MATLPNEVAEKKKIQNKIIKKLNLIFFSISILSVKKIIVGNNEYGIRRIKCPGSMKLAKNGEKAYKIAPNPAIRLSNLVVVFILFVKKSFIKKYIEISAKKSNIDIKRIVAAGKEIFIKSSSKKNKVSGKSPEI